LERKERLLYSVSLNLTSSTLLDEPLEIGGCLFSDESLSNGTAKSGDGIFKSSMFPTEEWTFGEFYFF
jgi:hypothetical protein